MDSNKELLEVHNIINTLPRSIKMMRLYKSNNPVYVKSVEECYERFKEYFQCNDRFEIQFRQNDIFYNAESVYNSTDRQDNLAFLFFKDGVKELSIEKDVSLKEMEDFLRILSTENTEDTETDIALLLWEKDCRNIKYVVDKTYLGDHEDYETDAMNALQKKSTPAGGLQEAFEELSHNDQTNSETPVIPLSEEDLQLIVNEIEKDSQDKTGKLITILFELFVRTEGKEDCRDIALLIMDTVKYCVENENVRDVIKLQNMVKQCVENNNSPDVIKSQAKHIRTYIGSKNIIHLIGEIYDKKQDADKAVFDEFVSMLDNKAILPMISTLGEMETIQGRKMFIEALIHLGRNDLTSIISSLHDSRWYVVRNVLYILGKIKDRSVTDKVLFTIKHEDIRVKKEAIKTLGFMGKDNVLDSLMECLAYPDVQIRIASVRAIGKIGTEKAKQTIMNDMSSRKFRHKKFSEKKVYFEVLSKWNDKSTFDFMIMTLEKKSLWKRAGLIEEKACAAYALGLMGNSSAVPILAKLENVRHGLLRDYARSALQRLKNGE